MNKILSIIILVFLSINITVAGEVLRLPIYVHIVEIDENIKQTVKNEIPIYDYRLIYDFIFSNNEISQYSNLSELLGYDKNDKLLIIHADDLGLSNSVNKASFDALTNKYINSASVMMPAPYSNEVANYFKENQDIDLGLHLTFTSEWKDYKWHGISHEDSISSLIDSKGNFYENRILKVKIVKTRDNSLEGIIL